MGTEEGDFEEEEQAKKRAFKRPAAAAEANLGTEEGDLEEEEQAEEEAAEGDEVVEAEDEQVEEAKAEDEQVEEAKEELPGMIIRAQPSPSTSDWGSFEDFQPTHPTPPEKLPPDVVYTWF